MGSYRTFIICILAALFAFTWPVAAQVSQEAFATDLIAACQEKNNPKVQKLIQEHRLWVKPVVNQLVTDYIHRTMRLWRKRRDPFAVCLGVAPLAALAAIASANNSKPPLWRILLRIIRHLYSPLEIL